MGGSPVRDGARLGGGPGGPAAGNEGRLPLPRIEGGPPPGATELGGPGGLVATFRGGGAIGGRLRPGAELWLDELMPLVCEPTGG